MLSVLLRLARTVLENVLSQMFQQFNTVNEQAINPLKTIVQSVVGGVWIGRGANAFVEELSSLAIPGIGQVADQINTLHHNVSAARDIIEHADEEADRMVHSRLFDTFEFY